MNGLKKYVFIKLLLFMYMSKNNKLLYAFLSSTRPYYMQRQNYYAKRNTFINCYNRIVSSNNSNRFMSSSSIEETQKLSMSLVNNDKKQHQKPLVIVISGPTGIGKSSLAYKLCSSSSSSSNSNGHIINADSVQVYKDVQIGANKPSKEELQQTQHHVIDMLSPMYDSYSAADWMNDTINVLNVLTSDDDDDDDDIISMNDNDQLTDSNMQRQEEIIENAKNSIKKDNNNDKILPIVVGGTMMYIQWLVHGRPDAMKPTEYAIQKSKDIIQHYISINNNDNDDDDAAWDDIILYIKNNLPIIFYNRTQTIFCGKDWYRLGRLLEVAFTIQQEQQQNNGSKDNINLEEVLYTGERSYSLSSLGYDVRCFFLCPTNRTHHAHILNHRCEAMIIEGLIQETTQLLLLSSSQQNEKQETNTNNDDNAISLNKQIVNSIGYRQTINYLKRNNPIRNDAISFDNYINDFMTSTRQYSKKQMAWFRKDDNFIFLPVDTTSSNTDTHNNEQQQLQDNNDNKKPLDDAFNYIVQLCSLSKEEYDIYLQKQQQGQNNDSTTTTTDINTENDIIELSSYNIKQINQEQGKHMRTFMPKRTVLIKGSDEYNNMLHIADDCTKIVQGLDDDF